MRQLMEDEDVMPRKEATKLYKQGVITLEELEEIRKINIRKCKRHYMRSEKGQRIREKEKEKIKKEKETNLEAYMEKRREYGRTFYWRHRDEIIERYNKKKKEKIETVNH